MKNENDNNIPATLLSTTTRCSCCDTALVYEKQHVTAAIPFSQVGVDAVSFTQIAVWAVVENYPNAQIEAQWPNGVWASIGNVDRSGIFNNPAVPNYYCINPSYIKIRVTGFPETVNTYPVRPSITSLSSNLNTDNRVSINGAGTLPNARWEAQWSNSVWASIGDADQYGNLSNPSIPENYRINSNTMRIRIRSGDIISQVVDSTLGFPHSRSVLIQSKMSGAQDQQKYSLSMQKADYQPTGYFAPANQEIEIWVSGNVDYLTLLVGTQGLADRDNPSNQSESMRATRLVRGKNVIKDMLGGIIHIRNLNTRFDSPSRVILGAGAIPIAYYIHGVTSSASWEQMLHRTTAPEVEWVGDYAVIVAFKTTALKNLSKADPAKVVTSHERVLQVEDEISGLDGSSSINTRSNLLIYAVEGAANANPHATTGYISIPYSNGEGYNAEALVGGLAANRWVTLHEYGHHHQNRVNNCKGFGEISVNLYSLAVARVTPNEYTYELPTRWPATKQWLARPREQKDFETNAPDPMSIFEQLRLGLGPQFLPSWDRYIRATSSLSSDLKGFILSASVVSNYNLTEFFADWGVLKTTGTDIAIWQAVNALGLPYPPMTLTDIQPYTDLAH